MSTKYIIISIYLYFKKRQILGYYNSTPLKMNLVLEIRKTVIEEMKTLSIDLHLIQKASSPQFRSNVSTYFDHLTPSSLLNYFQEIDGYSE
jgi:hypothetical protein